MQLKRSMTVTCKVNPKEPFFFSTMMVLRRRSSSGLLAVTRSGLTRSRICDWTQKPESVQTAHSTPSEPGDGIAATELWQVASCSGPRAAHLAYPLPLPLPRIGILYETSACACADIHPVPRAQTRAKGYNRRIFKRTPRQLKLKIMVIIRLGRYSRRFLLYDIKSTSLLTRSYGNWHQRD